MSEDNLHKGADPRLFHFARLNRKSMTEAEGILWSALRDRRLGYKFRRQHPISYFIADFYCVEHKLVVEVDGDYHNEEEQQQYDEGRVFEMNELGIKVIRFRNREVLEDLDFVLTQIKEVLER